MDSKYFLIIQPASHKFFLTNWRVSFSLNSLGQMKNNYLTPSLQDALDLEV